MENENGEKRTAESQNATLFPAPNATSPSAVVPHTPEKRLAPMEMYAGVIWGIVVGEEWAGSRGARRRESY